MKLLSDFYVYTVHMDPLAKDPYAQIEFIQEGFSTTAFLLGPLWIVFHRLWAELIWVLLAVLIAAWAAQGVGFSTTSQSVMYIGMAIIIGFLAKDWQRAKLRKQGYVMVDVVTGDTLLKVQQRFFERYLRTQHA